MDGFLIRYGKRGKKGQQRWFKLLGKRLLFFKQPGAKSRTVKFRWNSRKVADRMLLQRTTLSLKLSCPSQRFG